MMARSPRQETEHSPGVVISAQPNGVFSRVSPSAPAQPKDPGRRLRLRERRGGSRLEPSQPQGADQVQPVPLLALYVAVVPSTSSKYRVGRNLDRRPRGPSRWNVVGKISAQHDPARASSRPEIPQPDPYTGREKGARGTSGSRTVGGRGPPASCSGGQSCRGKQCPRHGGSPDGWKHCLFAVWCHQSCLTGPGTKGQRTGMPQGEHVPQSLHKEGGHLPRSPRDPVPVPSIARRTLLKPQQGQPAKAMSTVDTDSNRATGMCPESTLDQAPLFPYGWALVSLNQVVGSRFNIHNRRRLRRLDPPRDQIPSRKCHQVTPDFIHLV
ncbi:hypothetical protein B0J15DRAFT_558076 [Fusarium solani]|uniref:Uncharacterized protein n=1 Tax=Fusarium solani TaxID=169388 RepID=A0A9P9L873_FUSSL|nr:uncharacterized protein B0J15DRAFT_558076 [Fusarium solani]KAH7276028.1 hypothetical protein B0J15DRAFT_558076 [Fusarium solani]